MADHDPLPSVGPTAENSSQFEHELTFDLAADSTSDLPPEPRRPGRPGYAGYGNTRRGNDAHLLEYVRILYKRRWTAATAFLLVVLSVAVYTFTATPIYEASVQILIENADPNVVNFKEVLEQSERTTDYYQTQYRILQSRALARRTIDSLKLWSHPQISPAAGDSRRGIGAWLTSPINTLSTWFSKPQSNGQTQALGETAAQSAAIDRFLESLSVAPIRNSRLVDVRFRSSDPALAANVANNLANGYIQQNLETRLASSKQATDFLGEQLNQQRQQVESSERALQEYRERNDAVSLEDRQNIVVQKLADLNATVTRARTERIQKEAAYNQIRAVQDNRAAPDTLPSIVSNAFVQQQKALLAELQRQQAQSADKLGPRHPDMIKQASAIQEAKSRLDAEISKVVESIRNDYQQALAQERSLSSALDQQKSEALDLNRKEIEYSGLARDASANRQMFDSLLQRMKETGVSSELRTSSIRIVDEAEVPRSPATPKKGTNLLLAFGIGSLLSIGLAFFFEYLDSRIKNPDEIANYLNIPFLGMVPALPNVPKDENGGERLRIDQTPSPDFSESLRNLRTNLLFSSAETGTRTIIVTSTAPGEGKTTVASNLALALAMSGERVLLVDADMRRPRVHQVFALSQKPGLSNLLVGNAKASESIRKTDAQGLWVLPAGEWPPNPAELLGSKRFTSLLGSLSTHFDWLIVDTPPVMAVTDTSVVAHLVTGVLFVVGSEMTARDVAKQAVQQLLHSKATILGAVLNRVNVYRNAHYYAPYYRAGYASYYQRPDSVSQ